MMVRVIFTLKTETLSTRRKNSAPRWLHHTMSMHHNDFSGQGITFGVMVMQMASYINGTLGQHKDLEYDGAAEAHASFP